MLLKLVTAQPTFGVTFIIGLLGVALFTTTLTLLIIPFTDNVVENVPEVL